MVRLFYHASDLISVHLNMIQVTPSGGDRAHYDRPDPLVEVPTALSPLADFFSIFLS